MKKFFLIFVAVAVFHSCGNVNDFPIPEREVVSPDDGGGEDVPVEIDDDIVIDESALLNEKETILKPSDGGLYKDFLANFLYDEESGEWDEGSFDAASQQWTKGVKTMTILFSDDNVTYSLTSKKGNPSTIDAEDFDITTFGGHIVVTAHTKCNYVLKGTSANGSFKLYSDKKCIITLSDVNLTNPSGAAINIQKGCDGGKRTFLVVANGTRNFLCDGETYTHKLYPGTLDVEDEKGTIFSEGKICVSGNGYLNVMSKGKNSIACDDYVYLHAGPQITMTPALGYDGIKAKDGLRIAGGVFNITCSGGAAKGINSDALIEVSGGRTTVISTSVPVANADNSVSRPYCLQTDSGFFMSGGALLLSASKAGGNGIFVKDKMAVAGGTIKMVISDAPFTCGEFDKSGGTIYVNGKTLESQ